jgi:membrane protein
VALLPFLRHQAHRLWRLADSLTGGWLSLVRGAVQEFSDDECPARAAAISYYALFSLFPLVVLLIAIGSFLVEAGEAREQVLDLLYQYFPGSGDLIVRNVDEVLRVRGPVGLLALLGLLWSSSGVFSTLDDAINKAWDVDRKRPFWRGRLLGLSIAASIGGLFLLSLTATTVFRLVGGMNLTLRTQAPLLPVLTSRFAATVVPLLLNFVMFALLYKVVPYTQVPWSAACRGAVVAAVGWEVAKVAFAWYLASGLARYRIVYGSLGAVVVLLLWSYFSSVIVLFGAELGAEYAQQQSASRLEQGIAI